MTNTEKIQAIVSKEIEYLHQLRRPLNADELDHLEKLQGMNVDLPEPQPEQPQGPAESSEQILQRVMTKTAT